MRWPVAVITSLLLASHVTAGVFDIRTIVRREDTTERSMRRYLTSLVEDVEKRATQSAPTNGNLTMWEAQTSAACTTALAMLNGVASNPSGMAMCYNLAFLDTKTGVFQADLRLYKISSPTGDFSSVPDQNVSVAVQFTGASFSAVDPSSLTPAKRSMISWPSVRRDGKLEERQSSITLQQTYALVGQINKNLVAANLNA